MELATSNENSMESPSPSATRPKRREQLHDAEHRSPALRKKPVPRSMQRQHQDGGTDHDRETAAPSEPSSSFAARAYHRAAQPMVCSMMTREHDEARDQVLQLLAEAAQQQHDLDDGDDR